MPRGGGLAVVEACATICPIVILTVSESERDLLDAVAAGAAGYLLKSAPVDELRVALVSAAAGEPVFRRRSPRSCSASSDGSPKPPTATRCRTASGRCCNSWPAVSDTPRSPPNCRSRPRRSENHVRNILGKLHLTRRTDLVRYAVQHGLD